MSASPPEPGLQTSGELDADKPVESTNDSKPAPQPGPQVFPSKVTESDHTPESSSSPSSSSAHTSTEPSTSLGQDKRSLSAAFVNSPLNPATAIPSHIRYSRASYMTSRVASEESQVLSRPSSIMQPGYRGSMVLYRFATDDEKISHAELLPPPPPRGHRDSVISTSGESVFSVNSDSKYPSGVPANPRELVPYAYDPEYDDVEDDDADDALHDPNIHKRPTIFALRGMLNAGMLILVLLSLLAVFVCYPLVNYFSSPDTTEVAVGFVAAETSVAAETVDTDGDPFNFSDPSDSTDSDDVDVVSSVKFRRHLSPQIAFAGSPMGPAEKPISASILNFIVPFGKSEHPTHVDADAFWLAADLSSTKPQDMDIGMVIRDVGYT